MGNGRVQSSRSPDATDSMQQGLRAVAMRVVANISVATYFMFILLSLEHFTYIYQNNAYCCSMSAYIPDE